MAEFARFELTGVKEALETFSSKKIRQAIRSTLDKTGTYAKKEIVDGITKDYNIAARDVRDKIEVQRTTQNSLETTLKIKSKKISLVHFGARQAPKGVVVFIKRGIPTVYMEAWVRDRYVAIRKTRPWPKGVGRGKKGKGQGVDPERATKLKMKGLPGPSVTNLAHPILDRIRSKIITFMQETFANEIKKRIGY